MIGLIVFSYLSSGIKFVHNSGILGSKSKEKVFTGLVESLLITATILLESTPPLKNAPNGTSDINLRLTAL